MKEAHQVIRFGAAKWGALAMTALILAACQTGGDYDTVQPAPGMLTDGNIAAIVLSYNNAEVGTAELALQKSRNQSVREYAQLMLTQHEWAETQTMEVLRRTDLTRVPDAISRDLQQRKNETIAALETRTGEDFDETYINNQVEMHRWLLNALDQSLLPGAREDELHTWLMQLRPVVVDHLNQAEAIQAGLGSP